MFKVGDLKETLDFYEGVFGMHVSPRRTLRSLPESRPSPRRLTQPRSSPASGAPPRGVRVWLRGDLQRPVRCAARRALSDGSSRAADVQRQPVLTLLPSPVPGGAWSKTMVRTPPSASRLCVVPLLAARLRCVIAPGGPRTCEQKRS